MRILSVTALLAVLAAAGCTNQTVGERALMGAAAGGLIAGATGNNVAGGAAIGAIGNVAAACLADPNAPGC